MSVDASEWMAVGVEMDAHVATVDPRVNAGGSRVGRRMEGTAKLLAPELTGRLRDRVRATVSFGGGGGEIQLTSGAPYAPYVEDGTEDTAPQPHVGPAFESHQGELDEALLDASLDL